MKIRPIWVSNKELKRLNSLGLTNYELRICTHFTFIKIRNLRFMIS